MPCPPLGDWWHKRGSTNYILSTIVRVTPSLPQRGRQPKGSAPLTPFFFTGIFINQLRTSGNNYLIRRGGAPSGAAAFIVTGGMGVSTPIMGRNHTVISKMM